jgi:localization factor PodJL
MSQPQVKPEIFEQRLREIEARIDTVQNSTRHEEIAQTLRQHCAEFRDVLKEAPVEEITNIWRHDLEEIRSRLAAIQQQIATNAADAVGNPAESIRRDVAALKEIQTAVDRRTQDTFEAVYGTIEQVVDRLAVIENELALSAPPAADRAPPAPEPLDEHDQGAAAPSYALPSQPWAKTARLRRAAVPAFDPDASPEPGASARRARMVVHAIDRIAASAPSPYPSRPPTLSLPREDGRERVGNGEGRVAAAESAEPVRAKFVAAARRAAQALVGEQQGAPPPRDPPISPTLPPPARGGGLGRGAGKGGDREKSGQHAARNFPTGTLFQRLRPRAKSLMLGVSMVLLALGAFGAALDLFHTPAGQQSVEAVIGVDDVAEPDGEPARSEQPPPAQPPTRPGANLDERALPAPARALSDETTLAQTPPRGASQNSPAKQTPAAPSPSPSPQTAEGREGAAPPMRNVLLQGRDGDGASQHAAPDLTATPLPPTIGGKGLVAAANAGDPNASYEIAMRFAQGRNTTQDLAMAAAWLERAARSGLAPAQFRLATMYEKGLGVQKDLTQARSLYIAAAVKGHAKAMHNLAVLYARGIDGEPDYAPASQWFRQAAVHGVVDSQYNLAILYARGLGVERNFAESYKWLALAAKGGDKDAARKRDEVATRLDPKQLESAKLNAESFVAVPQPDEATAIKAPPGGWDQAVAAATAKSKPLVRPERSPGK